MAIQQAFLNLMLNAVQQMALKAEKWKWNGQRILEISTNFEPERGMVQIRFSDTGPGIHYGHWEKIFTPGFSTRGGSGLGLFIARNFLHSLGGLSG
jgi:signal transduction histidine kinase